ncbi:serine protease HTRA2, mitochondrial-like isoform X2 [Paramacrobiotus metropolitanus]|uniref:serine protease HTRA2, mitochondrial-like isoform X2 n=1 Tax=Paramacrobiotus metropolitanus TaxID=2943436 RepID=UPI002446149B|nr:serine protease HTRA2, mitochondrial-like isoform X2 [Paramacrobiotus metropolitanus]
MPTDAIVYFSTFIYTTELNRHTTMLIPAFVKFTSSSFAGAARPVRCHQFARCQWTTGSRTFHHDRHVMLSNFLRARKSTASIVCAAGSAIAMGFLYRWYLSNRTNVTHASRAAPWKGSCILRQVHAAEPIPRSRAFNFIADVVETIAPAVVYIEVQGRHQMFPGMLNLSQGSGFVVRENGLILTNAHVVANQVHVEVKFSDGRRLPGRVLYVDGVSDLAAVKVEATGLPFLRMGSSTKLRVGEWVIAVGSPLNLSNTVTTGVVSAFRGSAELGMRHHVEKSINYIQTDAAITFGNSGGPLLNLDGDVIGINAMKVGGAGISFAIPSDHAKDFLAKIDSLEQSSRQRKLSGPSDPVRPQKKVIGVTLLTLTPDIVMAIRQRTDDFPPVISGVLVHRIVPESPAERAGLRRGDVITSINGKTVASSKEVFDMVGQEDVLVIEFQRDGRSASVRLKPELVQ